MGMLRKISISFLLATALAIEASAASAVVWEEITSPIPAVAQTIDLDGDTDIAVHDNYIYIRADKTVTVKLFSILGQLISQETIKPGIYRIHIQSRGIYILRAGTLTRRITI